MYALGASIRCHELGAELVGQDFQKRTILYSITGLFFSMNLLTGLPMTDAERTKFDEVWQLHQEADWPDGLGSDEGQLMTLDTVISGCVTYFFDEQDLDEQRVDILRDCLAELEGAVEDLSGAPSEYFRRLQFLGTTLLQDYS